MNFRAETIVVPDVPFLTIGEVCRLVGYDQRTIRRWIDEGLFPPSRPIAGGRRAWTARSIGVWMAWQDYCPVPTAAPERDESRPPVEPRDRERSAGEDDGGGEAADLAARPKRQRGG